MSSAFIHCKHDNSAEKKHDTQVCDSIYREQSAEMKHDKQVWESIYRDKSAEYNVIHRFLAISTGDSLLRINMINRFTTLSTKGSLRRLNMILSQFVTIYREQSAELKHDTPFAILPTDSKHDTLICDSTY